MATIGIVVPVYKTELYLSKCIDSILHQSFFDFELVLVDDGSKDTCSRICDEYVLYDKRITVIHKDNGGLSTARNAAIDYLSTCSQCDYISLIDSDDFVEKDFLKRLYEVIDGCDMSVCSYYLSKDGKPNQVIHKTSKTCENGFWNTKFDGYEIVVAWNKLYFSKLFNNIRYPVGKIHEDAYVIHRVVGLCKTINIINDKLYCYNVDNLYSITRKEDVNSLLWKASMIEIMLDRCNYYLHNHLNLLLFEKNYYECLRMVINDFCHYKNEYYSYFRCLKKVYILKKERHYSCTKGEFFFYRIPIIYCTIKRRF